MVSGYYSLQVCLHVIWAWSTMLWADSQRRWVVFRFGGGKGLSEEKKFELISD